MIRKVLSSYYDTLSIYEKIFSPILIIVGAFILMKLFPILSGNFITSLIASFSIFIGFLFNLLLMLSNMVKEINFNATDPKSRNGLRKIKLEVIKKGQSIISAAIFFSISNLLLILLYSSDCSHLYDFLSRVCLFLINFKFIFIFIIYAFLLSFVHSIYNILNITHILLQKEIELKYKEFNQI